MLNEKCNNNCNNTKLCKCEKIKVCNNNSIEDTYLQNCNILNSFITIRTTIIDFLNNVSHILSNVHTGIKYNEREHFNLLVENLITSIYQSCIPNDKLEHILFGLTIQKYDENGNPTESFGIVKDNKEVNQINNTIIPLYPRNLFYLSGCDIYNSHPILYYYILTFHFLWDPVKSSLKVRISDSDYTLPKVPCVFPFNSPIENTHFTVIEIIPESNDNIWNDLASLRMFIEIILSKNDNINKFIACIEKGISRAMAAEKSIDLKKKLSLCKV